MPHIPMMPMQTYTCGWDMMAWRVVAGEEGDHTVQAQVQAQAQAQVRVNQGRGGRWKRTKTHDSPAAVGSIAVQEKGVGGVECGCGRVRLLRWAWCNRIEMSHYAGYCNRIEMSHYGRRAGGTPRLLPLVQVQPQGGSSCPFGAGRLVPPPAPHPRAPAPPFSSADRPAARPTARPLVEPIVYSRQ